jgi:secreted trypsin-like serine protease
MMHFQANSKLTIASFLLICWAFQLEALSDKDCKCKYDIVKSNGSSQVEIPHVPWLLSLGRPFGFDEFPSGSHFCAAVLINERWAITSAQCVASKSIKSIRVGLGSSDTAEIYSNGRLEIEAVIKHPANSLDRLAGNLALIKFAHEIKFNETIQPACFDTAPISPKVYQKFESEDFFMIGWAVTHNPKNELNKKVQQYPSQEVFKQTLNPGHICERRRALICANPIDTSSNNSIKNESHDELYGYFGSPLMMNKDSNNDFWF